MTGKLRAESGVSLRGRYLVQDVSCPLVKAFKRTSSSVDGKHMQLHVCVGDYREVNISLELV